jgi:hypothetical protein
LQAIEKNRENQNKSRLWRHGFFGATEKPQKWAWPIPMPLKKIRFIEFRRDKAKTSPRCPFVERESRGLSRRRGVGGKSQALP